MQMLTSATELHICWKLPHKYMGNNCEILSFLDVAEEEILRNDFSGVVHSAREIASVVKQEARSIYGDLIARIGATALPETAGKTFREALRFRQDASYWWFHKVTEKDCETDQTFNDIIQLLVIIQVAQIKQFSTLVMHGGSLELAQSLPKSYRIKVLNTRRKYPRIQLFLRAIASRLKYAFQTTSRLLTVKKHYQLPDCVPDVIFSGFWDWSVKCDEQGELHDRYFKSLPSVLESQHHKIAWFLWLDPFYEESGRGRSMESVIRLLTGRHKLILLQAFLTFREVLSAIVNLAPFRTYRRHLKYKNFRHLFCLQGLDFFPLLHPLLSYGFLNATLPHHELVYTASSQAIKRYCPRIIVSFLELFLHSRAFYLGCRYANPAVRHVAIQHASYCREKTFALLDPLREYHGEPDGLPVPVPDYLFAMGTLGKEIFEESGFPSDRVILTGSARYEHVTDLAILKSTAAAKGVCILLVTSLDVNTEMDMLEAVCIATKDVAGVQLRLRNHPFARADKHLRFRPLKDRMEISTASLEEDLTASDLIIFTSSTVAEEAFIRGIPVWAWNSYRYNASVFNDIGVVPSFNSVSKMKNEIIKYINNKELYRPKEVDRKFVENKCFYKADRAATIRIANTINSIW